MAELYKLTDQDGFTRAGHDNACKWGEGVSHSGTGKGHLCGPGWIHAYEHPLLAVVLNPIHANFIAPRMWVAEGEIAKRDGQLKVGCKTLTTLREIPLPVVSTAALVRFAVLCAKTVYAEPSWTAWRAADAAWAAARADLEADIDLIALLEQAVRDEAEFESASAAIGV